MKLCLSFKQYFYRAMCDWLHNFCGEWEGWALINCFNHTNWVTAVTPTDRPKSVRNRCVIEVFGGVFMLSRCFLDFSVGVGAFVIGLSQNSSFFPFVIRLRQIPSLFSSFISIFCLGNIHSGSSSDYISCLSDRGIPRLPVHGKPYLSPHHSELLECLPT